MKTDSYHQPIKAWLDNELSAARAAEVESHVAGCAGCQSLAQDYRRLSGRLQSIRARAVPLPDPDTIRARARQLQDSENRIIRILRRVAAVAAVFLIGTLGLCGWFYWQPDDDVLMAQGQDEVLDLVLGNPAWEEEY